MLALRRQRYLSQVAEISGAAGLAVALRNTGKGGKGVGLPPAAGTVVEALLVVALIAEAGAVTYFYRDKLAQVFRSITSSPKVEQVANPPAVSSPLPGFDWTPSPVFTAAVSLTPSPAGTQTGTLTPDGTPSPGLAADSTPGNGTGGTTLQSASTPPANGNNGNQYGLTPKPVRTKESGTTNSQDSSKDSNKKKP